MRLPRPRFTIRRMMVAVAMVALAIVLSTAVYRQVREARRRRDAIRVLDTYISVFDRPDTPLSKMWFEKLTAMRKKLLDGGPVPDELEPIEPE